MTFSTLLIISSVYLFLACFNKKLICLLSLELMMVVFIFDFLIFGQGKLGEQSSFVSFVLLCFMVLDSTLGISLLVSASRDSMPLSRGISI